MLRPKTFDLRTLSSGACLTARYVWEAPTRVGRFALEHIMNVDGDDTIFQSL